MFDLNDRNNFNFWLLKNNLKYISSIYLDFYKFQPKLYSEMKLRFLNVISNINPVILEYF